VQENKTNRIFLIGSIALGVLAMVISLVYLESAKDEKRTPGPKVLVTKFDLRDGAELDPARDLEAVDLDSLVGRFLVEKNANAYKRQRVNRMILARTPVLLGDLEGAPHFIPGGEKGDMVHMAIPLTKGSLVIPGDYIKLLVTHQTSKARSATAPSGAYNATTPTWETKPVLDKLVKVVMVNSKRSRVRESVSMADSQRFSSMNDNDTTAIVELKEEDALTILEQTGNFQLPVTPLICAAPKAP
jgi:Flp pilus assembly protein CpaB